MSDYTKSEKKEIRLTWTQAVKIALIAQKKTTADLAKELHDSGFNYSRNYVSSIVNGRIISRDLRSKISDRLGIINDGDDFITITEKNYAILLSNRES